MKNTISLIQKYGSAGVSRPLTEYRTYFARYITSRFPAEQSMSILGHASVETTSRHYQLKDKGLSAAMVSLWNKAFPAVPPLG